jgi:hypothetical protein
MHWENRTFILPEIPGGYTWDMEIATSEGIVYSGTGNSLFMEGRSVAVLVANKKK